MIERHRPSRTSCHRHSRCHIRAGYLVEASQPKVSNLASRVAKDAITDCLHLDANNDKSLAVDRHNKSLRFRQHEPRYSFGLFAICRRLSAYDRHV